MEGGPDIVKCHSNRFVSSGAAVSEGSGERDISRDSCRMRLMVGDFALNPGVLGVPGVRGVDGVGGKEAITEFESFERVFE